MEDPVKVDAFFIAVTVGLGLTAVGYILVSIYGLPLAYPALGGGIVLLAWASPSDVSSSGRSPQAFPGTSSFLSLLWQFWSKAWTMPE